MSNDVTVKTFPHRDPRLDWVSMHDRRSLNYPVRASLSEDVEIRHRHWPRGPVLDQGNEGACVGFGWTGEAIASPRPNYGVSYAVAQRFAKEVYYEAQRRDEWAGEDYSGTSVLAGAKVMRDHGLIDEFRWSFSIEDLRDSVIALGPVVIGIPWYSDMYTTRPSGLVEVGGQMVGGHALLVTGYHPGMRINGEGWFERYEVFRWRNSWGPHYGNGGDALILAEDLRDLLADHGEACVPLGRNLTRLGEMDA